MFRGWFLPLCSFAFPYLNSHKPVHQEWEQIKTWTSLSFIWPVPLLPRRCVCPVQSDSQALFVLVTGLKLLGPAGNGEMFLRHLRKTWIQVLDLPLDWTGLDIGICLERSRCFCVRLTANESGRKFKLPNFGLCLIQSAQCLSPLL